MHHGILLFFDVSGGEIVVILLFVLIFFGSKKIPEMARGLGKGLREIRDASDAIKREIQQEGNKMRDDLVSTGQQMMEQSKDKQLESASDSVQETQPKASTINEPSTEETMSDESQAHGNQTEAQAKTDLPPTSTPLDQQF